MIDINIIISNLNKENDSLYKLSGESKVFNRHCGYPMYRIKKFGNRCDCDSFECKLKNKNYKEDTIYVCKVCGYYYRHVPSTF